jgi:hypothetical protein
LVRVAGQPTHALGYATDNLARDGGRRLPGAPRQAGEPHAWPPPIAGSLPEFRIGVEPRRRVRPTGLRA